MRLILQPKSTKKDVASYSQLLKEVLQIRFLYLYRLYLVSALGLAVISKKLALAYFFVCALTALNRKTGIYTKPHTSKTKAETLAKRLLNWNTARSWLFYAVTTALWYSMIARPAAPLFSVQLNAGLQRHAKGLSQATKVLNHSLVYLNEDIVYNLFMAVFVTTVYTGYYAALENNLVLPKLVTAAPSEALVASLGPAQRETTHILGTFAAVPVLYFVARALVLAPFYALPMPGYVISATTRPSIVGVLLGCPIKWGALVLVWQVANKCYNAYLFRGPKHAGSTISQGSQDPCATLVTGLEAKRGSLTRLEAWLECLCVPSEYRRKLYSESWKQIFEAFKQYTSLVRGELQEFCPAAPAAQQETAELTAPTTDKHTIQVSSQQVVVGRQSRSEELVQALQTRTPTAFDPAKLKLKIEEAGRALKREILEAPYGQPFATTKEGQLACAVPDLQTLEYSLKAIASLAKHSVNEDEYGYVQGDVGEILEVLNELRLLAERVQLPSLEASSKAAFDEVVAKFWPYLSHIKLPKGLKQYL